MIASEPMQSDDTPIQKIIIRPTPATQRSRSHRILTTEKTEKVENDTLANEENSVIRVIHKLPPVKSVPLSRAKKYNLRKLRFRMDSSDDKYPIYYARTKVNGSFRNHPIRPYRMIELKENELKNVA